MLVKIRRCVNLEDFIMSKEISSEELQTYLKQAIELETDIAIHENKHSNYSNKISTNRNCRQNPYANQTPLLMV